ncbi:FeoB-associated Cys-rich membrane protein [Wielerella bovis]|nr:FeoB-associated Cys-rich membrane protein [Wielerella bovis]MCG7656328.1 FeoB-associated Cys-rich membrane protein [Wielerella bovis]MCG7658553.1 FeoB-associated Cys-rich membrane protein [Wielerella bovis]ULJ63579.1 FeoB-associated Cys-rich membrane protein [Wielerella bovis]ULJ65782.1 FeoB-associated Cys-rich membrane protein [Wielerella bovis]ULJ68177.1 FeoB-associated Cys-rich membrane protein [Wielerella bovis]
MSVGFVVRHYVWKPKSAKKSCESGCGKCGGCG